MRTLGFDIGIGLNGTGKFIVGRVEERNPTKGPKTPRHRKRDNDSFISPSV